VTRFKKIVTVLIPLPHTYNPDVKGRRRPIAASKYEETMTEIAESFGGGMLWKFPPGSRPRGYWWNEGHLSRDILVVLEVDITDNAATKLKIKRYAETVLLDRFAQDAIYLKFVPQVESEVVVCRRRRRNRE
jgi:hypothetical protein